MSEVRVFELAKELKMPAKQLLNKMRKAGIPVTGNFSEMSLEQAEIVRKMAKSAKDIIVPEAVKRTTKLQKNKSNKTAAETDFQEKKKKVKASKIVTISTKSKSDEEEVEDLPKRRVRRKRTDSPLNLNESDNDSDIISSFETDKIDTNSQGETTSENSLEIKKDFFKKNTDSETNEEKLSPSKSVEPLDKNVVELPQDRTAKLDNTTDSLKEVPSDENLSTDDSVDSNSENKTKKTKYVYTHTEEDDLPEKKKNPRRLDTESRRRGGGGQRDYYNIRERRPRRQKKASAKDKLTVKDKEKVTESDSQKHVFNPRKKSIRIGNQVGVAELAGLIGIKVPEILKKLMSLGIMATINQTISGENAELIAADFDISVEVETFELSDLLKEEKLDDSELEARAPIVTIMGHVDHGKTSLLDKIRETRIASGEAGGITQHIGAYHLEVGGKSITFLDTPGHEAFTSMRARGANITDVVVLVVAADDKVQPQTIEAIQHSRAAEVPIIVAVNKIDRPESDSMRIQQELLAHELIPEDLGGSNIFVKVSAKTGEGIEELLEMIHLQAEILELKSTPKGSARGTVIESRVRKGQGPVGTVLVQRGTINIGDYFVMGSIHGRIRSMFNESGLKMLEAGPSLPVEISGLSSVPEVGEMFVVLDDEKNARLIAEEKENKLRAESILEQQKTSLDNLFNQIEEGKSIELRIILKGDVQGSIEALKTSIEQIGDERISPRFLLCAVGNITETDITLASASDAIIVGFNVQMDAKAREIRSNEGVDVRLYDVIYNALDEIKAAMEGLLEPEIREEVVGHLEIREVFSSGKNGIVVGGLVTDGKMYRNCMIRVIRNDKNIFEGAIVSLKRFKDDVQEVLQNYECGMVLEFNEIENGDIVEAYEKIEESARL